MMSCLAHQYGQRTSTHLREVKRSICRGLFPTVLKDALRIGSLTTTVIRHVITPCVTGMEETVSGPHVMAGGEGLLEHHTTHGVGSNVGLIHADFNSSSL